MRHHKGDPLPPSSDIDARRPDSAAPEGPGAAAAPEPSGASLASEMSYRRLLHYALPLVLSNSGGVLLLFTDRLFLAWHSPESVAGAGTAGMIAICFVAFCAATTGFTVVFTAQYLGAGRPERLGPSVWQGWYLSVGFGLATLAISTLADPLFDWIGHGPAVRAAEAAYFRVYLGGSFFFMAAAALMGFFIGRGDNRVVMVIQLSGLALNAVLDYTLIFGKWGFPNLGVAGAAWATILAEVAMLAAGLALFWQRKYRDLYATGRARPEAALAGRILRFGAPSGLRAVIELIMWAVFLGLIGRLGDDELAVTNVAFTINSLAWQPMIGVGMAVSMLVGRAQGAERPDLSRLAMKRGWLLAQIWETAAAVVIIVFADQLLGFFFRDLPPEKTSALLEQGRMVLWFVAAYCLLDGLNVILAQGLIGAGDSWWTFKATLWLSLLGVAAMAGLAARGGGLTGYWLVATLYIGACGLAWVWRYRDRAWESMKVVEAVVVTEEPGLGG